MLKEKRVVENERMFVKDQMSNEKMSPKKKGKMIFSVEILDIGYTNSKRFAEVFSNKKKVTISVISTSRSSQTSNVVILILWTSRDHTSLDFLSRSQLVA